jgi:REP element-mobilizing transposase RayT
MEKLQPGKYYHIYNRGNNREDLFRTPDNYQHFLRLYEKYIFPIAETYAWVLMKNHFHLAVRVKEEEEILPFSIETADRGQAHCQGTEALSVVSNSDRGSHLLRKPDPSRQFSHLFNSYAQSYNNAFSRTGSLFEKPFHRKPVTSERYLRQLIIYIHQNPQHHGFVDDFRDYPWSSYGSILSIKPTHLSREKVLGWFNDKGNFVAVHTQKVDEEMIRDFIIE